MNRDPLAPFEPTPREPFDLARSGHLFRRAGFGGSLADRERAVREGPAKTLERLTGRGPGERVDEFEDLPIVKDDGGASLRAYRIWRMLAGRHRLQERMSHLLHDWFATSLVKVGQLGAMSRQLRLFDQLGLGRFDELLLALCQDPAMIRWLDNDSNVAGRPNENLARELFELFALGRGQGYTEHDIQEAARALTGWTVKDQRFRVEHRRHDDGTKQILGARGAFDGEDLVRITAERPESARFVARKLLAFFVHPEPADDEIEALAARYRAFGRDLGATLRVLLTSRLFFSERAYRSRIKDPVDLVVGTVRNLGATASPMDLGSEALGMGLGIGEPPSVEGWAQERAWLTSATWLRRANFAGRLAQGAFHCDPAPRAVLDGGTPTERAEHAVALLLDSRIGEPSRARLDAFLRTPAAHDDAALLHAVMLLPEAQLL